MNAIDGWNIKCISKIDVSEFRCHYRDFAIADTSNDGVFDDCPNFIG
jgi:hypothetical protein